MALDKLIVIVLSALGGTAVTIWLGILILAAFAIPFAGLALIPAAFVGYVIYRVISERVSDPTEDHYDRMDH